MGYYQAILDQETADELLEFAKRTYWQRFFRSFRQLLFWALPRMFWHGTSEDRVYRKYQGFYLERHTGY